MPKLQENNFEEDHPENDQVRSLCFKSHSYPEMDQLDV